jgi:uncharacterized protein YbcI
LVHLVLDDSHIPLGKCPIPSSTSSHLARHPALAGLPTAMKTQGEIEAAICDGMSRFEQEYMGRGPKHVRAHLLGDFLLVRLEGVLTAAEQHLVTTLAPEKGRDLLKEVRSQLIEIARPVLEAMVLDVTGVKTLSMHHDISTVRGEEVVLFTLEKAPPFREMKRK